MHKKENQIIIAIMSADMLCLRIFLKNTQFECFFFSLIAGGFQWLHHNLNI